METHTFPIAEPEASKLDRVTDQLRHQPLVEKAKDFLRSNPHSMFWPGLVVVAALGVKLLRPRRHYRIRRRIWRS
jgi:hypothetical protein